MPYKTGEEPQVDDVVTDSDRRVGFVSHIVHYGGGPAELVIQWNDDTLGIRYLNFEKLVLLERGPAEVRER